MPIFRMPGFNKDRYRYFRVFVLIRKFAREYNATYSTSLREIILRKHCNGLTFGRAIESPESEPARRTSGRNKKTCGFIYK